jgi:heptosyltransferase-3
LNPRPLAVRFGALGDMVMLTVAIRHLHARLGQPVDILAAADWTRPLLQGQPGVGDVFLLASRKPPYWLSPAQQRLVHELRARGAGPTWLFDHDNRKVCRPAVARRLERSLLVPSRGPAGAGRLAFL